MEALLAFFLFILLSPGMIITLPPGEGKLFSSETTNNVAILIHTVLFFIINKFASEDTYGLGVLNKAVKEISRNVVDVPPVLAAILFCILSPGFIVTIPPFTLMTETTNTFAIILHAFLFYILLRIFAAYRSEQPLKWIDDQIKAL